MMIGYMVYDTRRSPNHLVAICLRQDVAEVVASAWPHETRIECEPINDALERERNWNSRAEAIV